LTVNPLPEVPVISKNENTLTAPAADSYQWYFNDVAIVSATNQTYTYTQNGQYLVEVVNEYGCTAKSAETTINDVGIVGMRHAATLQVYPNPTNGQLRITRGHVPLSEDAVIEIFNAAGQNVGAYPCGRLYPCGRPETIIDISHLANGMYFLKVGNQAVRFVKE